MKTIERIGFVGIGRMGYPMASHLAGAGFELVLADTRGDVLETFVGEHGGTIASSLRGLGQSVDAAITMLPNSAIVRQVILDGDDCVAAGLAEDSVVMDMGTSDPTDTRALGEALAGRNIRTIDAPVAGGVVFAKDATLDILVSGDGAGIERCRPILKALGRHVVECGQLGNAHALKALNNFVNAATLTAVIEAMTIGRRFGIEIDVMVESLRRATTGRNHPLEKKILPHVLTRRFAHGGAMALMAKDVKIVADTARAIGAADPMARECAALWAEATERYGAEADQTEIVKLWEEQTGITLCNPGENSD